MASVVPFRAIMPPGDKAKLVANPPYDVVDAEEAATIARDNPLGFLRVARAEIDLPPGIGPYDGCVYLRAKENYERLRRRAPLTQDPAPHFYVYALEMDGRRQTGVVACASVDDYDNGSIRKHETTRRDKEDDRTQHIVTLRSQTGPIFLTYRDRARITELVDRSVTGPPLFDFVAYADIRHVGWRMPESMTSEMVAAFREVEYLYIADGHHRAASASRARAVLRNLHRAHTGEEEYNAFLSVIFPASEVRVMPYNRVVKDLRGHTSETVRDLLASTFEVSPAARPSPECAGDIHMYVDGAWWRLRFAGPRDCLSAVAQLDVSLLQELVLGPILGIYDPRVDERIDFVGGIHGTAELEQRVDSGSAAAAFAMYPVNLEQLMAIADAGGVMPPKSTWFEPKLRDGLFIHDI